jgi:hypothetical protein
LGAGYAPFSGGGWRCSFPVADCPALTLAPTPKHFPRVYTVLVALTRQFYGVCRSKCPKALEVVCNDAGNAITSLNDADKTNCITTQSTAGDCPIVRKNCWITATDTAPSAWHVSVPVFCVCACACVRVTPSPPHTHLLFACAAQPSPPGLGASRPLPVVLSLRPAWPWTHSLAPVACVCSFLPVHPRSRLQEERDHPVLVPVVGDGPHQLPVHPGGRGTLGRGRTVARAHPPFLPPLSPSSRALARGNTCLSMRPCAPCDSRIPAPPGFPTCGLLPRALVWRVLRRRSLTCYCFYV